MSKYTTELRFICEDLSGLDESVGYNGVAEVIEGARSKIFDFYYPIFDNAYKPTLETKILRHFYTREICAETYGRWKLFLEAKMNEIMPYFNKLYESELLEFQPLYDADYYTQIETAGEESGEKQGTYTKNVTNSGSDSATKTNSITSTNSGTDQVAKTNSGSSTLSGSDVTAIDGSKSETTSTTSRDKYSEWDLYSDTPQGGIAGITGAEDPPSLGDNAYLTNARHILHDGDGTQANGTATTTDDTEQTVTYGRTDTVQGTSSETVTHGKVNTTGENGTDAITYGKKTATTGGDTETSEGSHSESTDKHTYGRLGGRTGAELLLEYRKTFLNIDMEIIKALEPLFFGLW